MSPAIREAASSGCQILPPYTTAPSNQSGHGSPSFLFLSVSLSARIGPFRCSSPACLGFDAKVPARTRPGFQGTVPSSSRAPRAGSHVPQGCTTEGWRANARSPAGSRTAPPALGCIQGGCRRDSGPLPWRTAVPASAGGCLSANGTAATWRASVPPRPRPSSSPPRTRRTKLQPGAADGKSGARSTPRYSPAESPHAR